MVLHVISEGRSSFFKSPFINLIKMLPIIHTAEAICLPKYDIIAMYGLAVLGAIEMSILHACNGNRLVLTLAHQNKFGMPIDLSADEH